MFESVRPDPGEKGQISASNIFYISTVGNVAGALLAFFQYRGVLGKTIGVSVSLVFAALAYMTAKGLEGGKQWAMRLGIIQALLSLLNIPVGTVIGIAALVYLNRANKAGLLNG
ncbi:MAG: hypothetical protein WB973_17655 [Thermoanaerobaculia bacterium]